MGRARGFHAAAGASTLATGPKKRGRRWTDAEVEAELRALAAQFDSFPTAAQMEAAGRCDLRQLVKRRGGSAYWARRVGKPLRSAQDRRRYETAEAMRDARAAIAELGSLPGQARLRSLGYNRLASFIQYRCGSNSTRFIEQYLRP